MIPFTYYGDLLGIGATYKLGNQIAKKRLVDFYTKTFHTLRNYCDQNQDAKVEMFSDSLFIYGDNALKALEYIPLVYTNLLSHDIMLRGAMVYGKLEFEPRLTLQNFEKNLPKDDILARANGLEKMLKGARFVIENKLAEKIFENYPDWATNEGYQRSFMNNPNNKEILKRICPTPDQTNYEYLYFWTVMNEGLDYKTIIKQLQNVKRMTTEELQIHYKETIDLIKRCEIRKNISLTMQPLIR